MISKKAQGISTTTIVVAVIALIVLIILIAIFSGKIAFFSRGVDSCTDKGGTCIAEDEDCPTETEGGKRIPLSTKLKGLKGCAADKPVCCVPIYTTAEGE